MIYKSHSLTIHHTMPHTCTKTHTTLRHLQHRQETISWRIPRSWHKFQLLLGLEYVRCSGHLQLPRIQQKWLSIEVSGAQTIPSKWSGWMTVKLGIRVCRVCLAQKNDKANYSFVISNIFVSAIYLTHNHHVLINPFLVLFPGSCAGEEERELVHTVCTCAKLPW